MDPAIQLSNARSGRSEGPAALGEDYFFTHLLPASSHFMVEIFSHSAFVLGTPLATAIPGATAPKATAARMAVVISFLDISTLHFLFGCFMITRPPSCAVWFAVT